ncbi:GTP-binding protein Era [Mycoplasmopsis meleagridis]|uniref:GTPase Era n=1 Tax=Mycoplasmopsis meleagridis ATCC 25294 TaxID=1264554 RepID=A0A0F5H0J5_9BACT|nr:GTPase Era [Mycoplasmopsis meleagridis]KKB26723.1 GTP-binding protein Era [Mycoplasmopsis meleagridis ATCC 25294]OAD18161.1 GTP-binding protein Era [Mycoplasmopsis meleagridis]VEU77256.1 GTP-binding protein [Mycoplasmopsis meleagridis]
MNIGMFSIIGRPNVGKSSLLNKILNYNLAIVSNVAQTTRDQITGIYSDESYQLVFIDTPGIHKPKNLLGEKLNKSAFDSIIDIDCILFLTPINETIGKGDRVILDKIKDLPNKIAIITKIDLAKKPEKIQHKLNELEEYNFSSIISVSINNKKSIDSLLNLLKTYTYEGEKLYDSDFITDKTMRFLAKELIREAAIYFLREELPHSIAVEINEFNEYNDFIEINATVYVKKDSQKGMLIGKKGSMIKQIGILARKKIESLFGTKVVLNTKVKVAKKWIDDEKMLKKFEY